MSALEEQSSSAFSFLHEFQRIPIALKIDAEKFWIMYNNGPVDKGSKYVRSMVE